MKIALFLVGTLAVNGLWTSVLQAAPAPGRKIPGPSAIEAARLKKSPPPGYLSHYLPDDRYKIAGGVWKYVSTDLDTYYHVPSSANMLRQPASSVIGFANSHDAEEAGYVADPTDGTANRTETTRFSGNSGGRTYVQAQNRVVLADGKTTISLPPGWTVIDKQASSKMNEETNKPYFGGYVHLVYKGDLKTSLMIMSTVDNYTDLEKDADSTTMRNRNKGSSNPASVMRFTVGPYKGSFMRLPGLDATSPRNLTVILAKGNTSHQFSTDEGNQILPGILDIVKSLRQK